MFVTFEGKVVQATRPEKKSDGNTYVTLDWNGNPRRVLANMVQEVEVTVEASHPEQLEGTIPLAGVVEILTPPAAQRTAVRKAALLSTHKTPKVVRAKK